MTGEPLKLDQVSGGCWPACLAGLTGIPHEALTRHVPPNFRETMNDDGVWNAFHNAILVELHAHGWTYDYLGPRIPRGFAIGVGKSPRGLDHAVIVHDGVLWHDPHPSRAGLVRITSFEILVPILGILSEDRQ
jgi:hypothetical protein